MAVEEQLDLDEIDRSMTFHPSDAWTVSCGTVTMDFSASKILLIWHRIFHIHQLPKGRKHVGEDFLTAALRETYEETGYKAEALTLKMSTRAQLPATRTSPPYDTTDEDLAEGAPRAANKNAAVEGWFQEPIGCCWYPDPQSSTPADKLVIYYAATADSTLPRAAGAPEELERLEEEWVPAAQAIAMLRFKAEADVVRKVLENARCSGLAI